MKSVRRALVHKGQKWGTREEQRGDEGRWGEYLYDSLNFRSDSETNLSR